MGKNKQTAMFISSDEIFSETVIPDKLPILELDLHSIFVKSKSVT
jgi:hypothetical protein